MICVFYPFFVATSFLQTSCVYITNLLTHKYLQILHKGTGKRFDQKTWNIQQLRECK